MQSYNMNYGSPDGYGYYYARLAALQERMRNEKRAIRKLGNYIGGAILLYVLLQNVYSVVISFMGLGSYYLGSELVKNGIDILLIMFSILPAFILLGKKMKNTSGVAEPISFGRPTSALHTLLAFFAGMAICMAANYVTAFVSVLMTVLGYTVSSPDTALPTGVTGILITVVQIAVVAALVEEICLRGHVMGNLRKYGDGFAIGASAIIFGLIHGNLVQAPFALVVGLALGYFTIKTKSIWTGILIHAGNNLFSVIISYMGEFFSEQVLVTVYMAAMGFFLIFGLICLAVFLSQIKKSVPDRKPDCALSGMQKFAAFFSSPAIIAVVVLMLIITASYIEPIGQVS